MEVNAQFEREARAVLWVRWVFFNVLGWTIGRFFIGGYEFDAFTRFAVIGLFFGFFQWIAMRRHTNMRAPQWLIFWVLFTALGLGLGRWMAGISYDLLPGEWTNNATVNVITRILISGLFGMALGAGVGLAQSVLIGRKLPYGFIWLILNIVGWTIAFQFDALLFSSSVIGSILKSLLASMVTGLGIVQFLNYKNG